MFLAYICAALISSASDTTLSAACVSAFKERVPSEKLASSVSVILPHQIKSAGITRAGRLSSLVPSLHIPEYGASLTSSIYLRGLGSRMENPSMGLYVDGIPIMDKNAYDFDWFGLAFAALIKGPGACLYGRNSMSGTLVLESRSPESDTSPYLFAEAGYPLLLRAGFSGGFGRHVISAEARHRAGRFENEYKNEPCDPYDGISLRWKWVQEDKGKVQWSNSLFASASKEGGFAYGLYEDGVLHPVSYNGEGSYRRISIIEGLRFRYKNDSYSLEGATSLQFLGDDMRMDQDFTPQDIFTLRQKQNNATGTFELLARYGSGTWQHSTGTFAFLRHNGASAPVTFGRAGIESLILDGANRNIPPNIGYLSISDGHLPVNFEFGINSFGVALFHESVFSLDRWRLTAGLRVDYEAGMMDYDCISRLHYRFVPTMNADKELGVPYSGTVSIDSGIQFLPRITALYDAGSGFSVFANISRGSRAGGFNTQIFSDILQNKMMNAVMKDLGVHHATPIVSVVAENTRYKPEKAWSYELGCRLVRERLRLEGSLYYMDVRDLQITVFPPGKSTGRMMKNAGRSRIPGAEAEADWQPGSFRLHASYAWCGTRVPYIPQNTAYLGGSWHYGFSKAGLDLNAAIRSFGPLRWDESGSRREAPHIRPEARIALVFPKLEIWIRGENLSGGRAKSFYFKSVGREFFAREAPISVITGININL